MYCRQCDSPNPDSATRCSVCGAALTPTEPAEYHPTQNLTVPDMPLKWYYFLIYFQLFVMAVIQLLNGIMTLMSPQLYGIYTAGAWVHAVVMGVAYLGMAVFVVIVRFQLARFRVRAPMLFKIYMLLNWLLPLADLLLSAALCPALNQDAGLTVSNLFGGAVFVVLNWIYFSKRKDCFIY